MTLPSIEAARGWSGLTVVDSDDEPLGRITHIYLDRDTGLPEWALVAMPQRGRRTFVPLAGAARKGDQIAVAVQKGAVSEAPAIRPARELSDGDAVRLYGHYVGTSDDRSRGARRAPRRSLVARPDGGDRPARKVRGGSTPGGQGSSAAGRAVGPRPAADAGWAGLGADGGCGPRRAGPAPSGTGRP